MTESAALGSPVLERLGARLEPVPGPGDVDPRVLLGLALRRNPRRAQLLVSRVLGKHVPADPRLVRAAGLLLGGRVADVLAGRPPRALPVALLHAAVRGEPGAAAALQRAALPADPPADALVVGYAETATGLGHCVAEGLGGADYLHSTRRAAPGARTAVAFTEDHSHAVDHLLLPRDPTLLDRPRPLVLVDDELSTGRTVANTITALHRIAPRDRYVVAALVDVREGPLPGLPCGIRADVVSLARAVVRLPEDVAARADALRAELGSRDGPPPGAQTPASAPPTVALRALGWPGGVPAGGRHGFPPAAHRALGAALPGLAAGLARAAGLRAGEHTLVLGTEELLALPLRLAAALADAGHAVGFSSTTRSPAVVADEPGYALRSGITFPAHDEPADGPGPRFAYNLARAAGRRWDHVLVVVDSPADTAALRTGLLAALAPHTRRTTVVIAP